MIDGNFVFESEMGMIKVGDRCHIGNGSLISRSRIVIGNDVTMAWGFTIYALHRVIPSFAVRYFAFFSLSISF